MDVRDPERVRVQIVNGIRDYFESAGFRRAVVGVSGGLDSAVTLALTAAALSPRNTFPVALPSRATPKRDVEDAIELVSFLDIPHRNLLLVRIDGIVSSMESAVGKMGRLERANAVARTRMVLLYALAHRRRALVVGTGDRSEIEMGYFTKHGDGGVDLLPLGRLLKTQVKHMAHLLGLPKGICEKPPSPRLWIGQLAERELGVSYEAIDEFIHLHIDKGMGIEDVSSKIDVPVAVLRGLKARTFRTAHKRSPPPVIACNPF